MQTRLKVSRASRHDLAAIASLLSASASLPYRFFPDIPRIRAEEYLLEILTARLAAAQSGVLVGWIDGKPAGLVAYEPLPWESKIVGRKIAGLGPILNSPLMDLDCADLGLIVAEAIACVRADGIELVTAKSYTTDTLLIHALELHGFQLMDTVVEATYRFPGSDLPADTPCPAGFSIRLAGNPDIPELRQVSRAAFAEHFGRFHADPRIGPETGTRLYEEWIQACVEGWGDRIILAEHEGRIAGFSVWKKPSAAETNHQLRIGHYSIGAIHPDFFGRGLFKFLTYEGMRFLQGSADYLEGPTHIHNLPVQRGYLKLGWHIADSRHSFHKWLV